MGDQVLYRGLVRIHILFHASRERVFGLGLMHELRRHGYAIGPGTLYPLLHDLEARGYLESETTVAGGRARRAYAITARGRRALRQARSRVRELFREVVVARPAATGRNRPRGRPAR